MKAGSKKQEHPDIRAARLSSQAKLSLTAAILGTLITAGLFYLFWFKQEISSLFALGGLSVTSLAYLDMRSRFKHAKKLRQMSGGLEKPAR